ncbi:MAG: hypothetical protein FWD27_01130 [Coriobacteriia bacterium]|nr:hypothetical protein [Coriobacteriia bacterium]
MDNGKVKFYAHSPIHDADISVYEDAFEFVFANDNIKNIALSGSYGSGKSSILETYKKKHTNKIFVHISLAHFRSNKSHYSVNGGEGERGVSQGDVEARLEGKILNQLIHQIPPKRIPLTNFRVKKVVSKKRNLFAAILLVAGAILGLYTLFSDEWFGLANINAEPHSFLLLDSIVSGSRFITGMAFFLIAGYFIYKLLSLQEQRHIVKKAGIGSVGIELFEEHESSFFDKYLNEVLYLFERVKADVIVFEDIDRYESSLIFERLREINTLVNNSRGDRRLRFFYLMRDDIFETADRVKFFDFIIPVVPVIDSSNSYNKFIQCFQEIGYSFSTDIDQEFLQGLSLYVDDMRILQNICNEFTVYRARLTTTEQDPNKMLAVIAYKNLFPRDFSELQLGRGFISEVIDGSGREGLVSARREELQTAIASKTEELERIKNEPLFSDEIAIIYNTRLSGNTNYVDPETCKKRIEQQRGSSQNSALLAEYDRRLNYSSDNDANRKERIQLLASEISEAKLEAMRLEESKLKDIITRDSVNTLFECNYQSETGKKESFESLKDSHYFPLLKYLVREGYIDETYADYMTYFYENSISRRDMIFLRSVADKRAKQHVYPLDRPSMVASRLSTLAFEEEETLNYKLFDFLLADFLSTEIFVTKTRTFIQQLSGSKHFEFVIGYGNTTNCIANLVEAFGLEWKSFIADCYDLADGDAFPFGERGARFVDRFARTLLAAQGRDHLTLDYLNDKSKEILVQIISNDTNFLTTDNSYPEDLLAQGIKKFGVCFKAIKIDNSNPLLLEKIYNNNSYEINYHNLRAMVSRFYSSPDLDSFRLMPYTILMTEADSSVAAYVNSNINDFFNAIFEDFSGAMIDAAPSVVALLNKNDANEENMARYISQLETEVPVLQDVKNEDLWQLLLKNHKTVRPTSQNIVSYFFSACNAELDDALIDFLNTKGFGVEFCNSDFSNAILEKEFFDALVTAKELDDNLYRAYIKQFDYILSPLEVAGLSQQKLSILDLTGKLEMTGETLEFIREHYEGYAIDYIKAHIQEYISLMADTIMYSHEEAMKILNTDITISEKIEILKLDGDPIPIAAMELPDEISAYIIHNNYDSADFDFLLRHATRYAEKTQEAILELAINNIDSVISQSSIIEKRFVALLFGSHRISAASKKKLLIALAPAANDEEIKCWLPSSGLENYLQLYNARSRPKFDATTTNETILEIFRLRGLIKGYVLDEQGEKYTIIRHSKKDMQ